jgi:hypothetical protein
LGDLNDLENSEDCRSAGGHGNQHVRLRSAQIATATRSARLAKQLLASSRGRRFRPDLRHPDLETVVFILTRYRLRSDAKLLSADVAQGPRCRCAGLKTFFVSKK